MSVEGKKAALGSREKVSASKLCAIVRPTHDRRCQVVKHTTSTGFFRSNVSTVVDLPSARETFTLAISIFGGRS